MKDLNNLRNLFIEHRFIKLHRGGTYQITPQNKLLLNSWIDKHKQLWDSYVSEYECEKELWYFINHPNIQKSEFVCKTCGKPLTFSQIKKHNITCSKECHLPIIPEGYLTQEQLQDKFKEYSLSFAGVDRVLKHLGLSGIKIYPFMCYSPEVVEKVSQFYLEHPNQKRYFTEKTNQERYGSISPFSNKDVVEKGKKTKLRKYGNEYYNNRDKCRQTCLSIYGVDNPFKSEMIKEKSKQTMKQKYGVEFTTQSPELQKKIRKSNQERYGVDYFVTKPEVKRKMIESTKQRYDNIRPIRKKIIQENLTAETLAKKFGVVPATINFLANHELNISHTESIQGLYIYDDSAEKIFEEYFSRNIYHSKQETEICDYLKTIYDGEILINDRKVLNGDELDLYIPEKNVAVEVDGVYWHCEVHKPKNYHLDKTIRCENKGIRLIHIYESDWRDKKNICKSILSSAIGVYSKRYYARNLKLSIVDNDVAKLFYNQNHLQGLEGRIDVSLALLDENSNIIQCCSFVMKNFHSGETELIRMATKLNCQVVGGFSKLVSHFVKEHNVDNLVSYINRAWFNGKGYYSSGFQFVHNNPISYYVVYHETLVHKSKFRKQALKKMFEQGKLRYYNENDTEEEIEHKNNLYRFYDCGTIKVKYVGVKHDIRTGN